MVRFMAHSDMDYHPAGAWLNPRGHSSLIFLANQRAIPSRHWIVAKDIVQLVSEQTFTEE